MLNPVLSSCCFFALRGAHAVPTVLLVTGAAIAQSVNLFTSALTPIVTTIVDGPQVAQATLPVGPLPFSGVLQPQWPGQGHARVWWSRSFGNHSIDYQLAASAVADPQVLAACERFEVLIELSASTARTVTLEFSRSGSMTAGQPWPQLDIDIDNDGVVDYVDFAAGTNVTLQAVQLGASPRFIRVIMAASAVGPAPASGQASVEMLLRVLPDNNLLVLPEALGCPVPFTMEAPHPALIDQGFDVIFSPGLLIVGFAAAPSVWTPTSVLPFASTCILLPSPDIVLWVPTGWQHVPLPAALRPLELHVQAVIPGLSGFGTSDAYAIYAW